MKRRRSGLPPSMVDLAFVLVFLFVLVSTLAKTTSEEARERILPPVNLSEIESDTSSESGLSEIKTVVVTLTEQDQCYLDSQQIDADQLKERLSKMGAPCVEIRADQNVRYGDVMGIMRTCRSVGIRNVVMTYEESQ
jgi:biopolymer transport protein ExbD